MKRISAFLIQLLVVAVATFTAAGLKAQSLDRVEPEFWWAGMNSPKLQLLLYGKDISALKPHIDHKGVVLERDIRVKSPNYLFIDLDIGQAAAGKFDILLKNGDKTVLAYTYELKERKEGSAMREGFNSHDVMYLITPDRFANGDPKNDAVKGLSDQPNREHPGGRHGGDIQGILDNLDYLEGLGVTALWVNPVLENNQPEYSYHGYSTTDYYKVDARYGSNELYKKLIGEANKRGIKFIMDMIVNHCGSEHWWMNDLPTDDWLNFQQGWKQTNHRREALQDPYASEADRKLHNDGWFVQSMPDLNQNNPLMGTYLIQNSIWWIEYAGLAGIRMDTYSYPDKHYMTEWTRRVMEEYPNFNVVGEEWSENPAIVAHWQRGKANYDGYVSYLRSVMDFPLQTAITQSLTAEENPWNSGLIQLYQMLANDFLYPNPNDLVVFLDNHDMSRFYTQVGEDPELLKMGLAYIFTMRGIPQLYYGTEILLSNPGTEDHGVIRSDFPGGWKGDKINAFTGKGLSEKAKDVQSYIRKLLQWRKTATAVTEGRLTHYAPESGHYVYFRYNGEQKVMVVLNKNTEPSKLKLGRFGEHLKGAKSGLSVVDGKSYDLSAEEIEVPAKSALILEVE